jgi:hypothetical protein
VDLLDSNQIIKIFCYWANGNLHAFGITFTNRQSLFEELIITSKYWIWEGQDGQRQRVDGSSMKEYDRAEGVSAGFGVDSELASDLSRGIGVSEMAECWEKVQCTSGRPHIDLVPGGNGTGTRLACADT